MCMVEPNTTSLHTGIIAGPCIFLLNRFSCKSVIYTLWHSLIINRGILLDILVQSMLLTLILCNLGGQYIV